MKKLICFLIALFIFNVLFEMPSYGLSGNVLQQYIVENSIVYYNPNNEKLGSRNYWEKQIQEKKWMGENRPEALMGDANIDGKITAEDALFALRFSVDGNIQTMTVIGGVMTPPQVRWYDEFLSAYQQGTLSQMAQREESWYTYCSFNSPFFADVTKDCVVNAKDALKILQYCVGKAEDFPVGDFTHYNVRFSYYPWPTEYYPEIFTDLRVSITDEEFCEKYNFSLEETPTDIQ